MKTPAYRANLTINGKTSEITYDYKRHGAPTDAVAENIRIVYNESFAPGGANADENETLHVSNVEIYRNNATAELVATTEEA